MEDSKPFREKLRQLVSALEEELQQHTTVLRHENTALRAKVQQLQCALHESSSPGQEEVPPKEPAAALREPRDPLARAKQPITRVPFAIVTRPRAQGDIVPVPEVEQTGKAPANEPASAWKQTDTAEAQSNKPHAIVPTAAAPQRRDVQPTASGVASALKQVCGATTNAEETSDNKVSDVFQAAWACERRSSRDLVFERLAEQKYPGSRWGELTRRQQTEAFRLALKPKHWLVPPRSRFMMLWDMATGVALCFCGFVTPYEAVFLSVQQRYWGLWTINRIVDLLFISDCVLQFFLMVEVQKPHNGGIMLLKDPAKLRRRYLKSWFIVDVLSTMPYELISFWNSSVMQTAKVLRLIKLLRMVKLLRLVGTSRIFHRWRDDVSLPFATQRLLGFLVVLLLLSHWMACVWGFVGLTVGEELCVNGNVVGDVELSKVSWVTTLFLGGKTSPDSACRHSNVYAASFHWAVMTITSIGYGDIVPVRMEEYVVGIICMYAGGVLWAYAIGSVCSIISNGSPMDISFEQDRDLLNRAMHRAEVPRDEQHTYREFLREAKSYDRRVKFREVAGKLSTGLRNRLLYHVMSDAIGRVYYFRRAPMDFVMGVASALVPHCFARGEALDSLSHSLCMMDRGTCVHYGMLLVPPNVFHEDFIITNPRLHRERRTFALTYAQVLVLTREDMELLLVGFPEFERTVRKYAVRIAFCRALHLAARNSYCLRRGKSENSRGISLSLAFSETFQIPRASESLEQSDAPKRKVTA